MRNITESSLYFHYDEEIVELKPKETREMPIISPITGVEDYKVHISFDRENTSELINFKKQSHAFIKGDSKLITWTLSEKDESINLAIDYEANPSFRIINKTNHNFTIIINDIGVNVSQNKVMSK